MSNLAQGGYLDSWKAIVPLSIVALACMSYLMLISSRWDLVQTLWMFLHVFVITVLWTGAIAFCYWMAERSKKRAYARILDIGMVRTFPGLEGDD